MGKIITITGQKGGCGKSTTAVNLSACLAVLEKKTLLIDCDPQANATIWSGIQPCPPFHTLTHVLSGKCSIDKAVHPTDLRFLSVIPSDYNLMFMADKLSKSPENKKILRLLLEDIKDDYDYIIIDAPSSYHFLSLMALMAGTCLVVTLSPSAYATRELAALGKTIRHIQTCFNIHLPIARFIGNRLDSYDRLAHLWDHGFPKTIKELLFSKPIPEDVSIQQACAKGLPAAVHDFKSPAARSFLSAAREISDFI